LNHFLTAKQLLNRKFKIGFATVHKDDSGNLTADIALKFLSDDMGIVPVIKNNKIVKFQIFVGGGQGERNGKPSMHALPFH